MRKTDEKRSQDERHWFVCDPALNRKCRKRSCFLYGGACELTSSPECAVKDDKGEPVEVNPRERLKEKMRARREGKGPYSVKITI